MTTRRLAAFTLPLLLLGTASRPARAKALGPQDAAACGADDASKRCAEAKGRFLADGGDTGGCPHCAALSKGKG